MSLKSNSFLNRFFNDWIVKCVSLMAAIALYIFNSFNTREVVILDVPLQVILPDEYALSSPHRDTITFTVAGQTGRGINELTPQDFLAVAVLPEDNLKPGTVKVYVREQRLGKALEMTGIVPLDITMQPLNVDVQIEERGEKVVPVIPVVTGGPEEGFTVYAKSVNPERVTLVGATSRLRLRDRVNTAPISYTGYRQDFFLNARLVLDDPLIKIKEGQSVEFSGYIEEILSVRTISAVPLILQSVNAGLEANLAISEGIITIRAPDRVLKNFSHDAYKLYVDCANISAPGRYQLKTTPEIPARSTLISHSPLAVEVDFNVRR